MSNTDREPIRSPKIRVEFIEPQVIADIEIKGFRIIDLESGRGITVMDNFGSPDKPYKLVASGMSRGKAGKLFFDLANQNPDNPRDIYVDINGVILRVNPAEKIPVQIYDFTEADSEDMAPQLQQETLEEIQPGLSNVLFEDNDN